MNMGPRHYHLNGRPMSHQQMVYDKWLILSVVGLLMIGLMMVASSSVVVSTKEFHEPFHYLIRQICYLTLALFLAFFILRTSSNFWQKISVLLMFICLLLLIMVLIPGVGRVVNGSRRWIALGPIGIQVSETAKFIIVIYMASFLVRQKQLVKESILGFINPLVVLSIVSLLLLLEPDFGATFVIVSTVMTMLFLTEVKLRYYFGLLIMVGLALLLLAFSSPYRVMRLTSFLNPWADQFNSGYQLTQSLIAFGRGGFMGVGLGDSVQKLFYLPEAHTDFLFAVLAEELGLLGILFVIFLYSILIFRGLTIGHHAFHLNRLFASYVAFGITTWIGMQAAINIGVNAGLLPTKGLTLPLMSYGGASLLVSICAIALLLRIDHENRWQSLGLKS